MAFITTLILTAALFVLGELLRPKPKLENARAATLRDFSFPTATESRVVPIVWGTVKVSGPNVVWYGDLNQFALKQKVKTSLFSSRRIIIGYRYSIGIQFAICRGPIDELSRIWVEEREVFSGSQGEGVLTLNFPNLFGGDKLGSGGLQGDLSVYLGTEVQNADPYLSDFQKFGTDTPAYRGTAYCVWRRGVVGSRTTLPPWAFEVRRIPTQLSVIDSVVNGADANPAHVLYELLTNDEYGLGFPGAEVDTVNFQEVAATMVSEGNGFSYALQDITQMEELINELELQIDGTVYLDQRTGKWKIKLVRDDFDVNNLFELNQDNIVRIEEYSAGSWDDTVNQVKVPYVDRSKDYFETSAVVQDLANFRIQGRAKPATMAFLGVKNGTLAARLATRELRSLALPRKKLVAVVDRSAWDVIPGQAIKVTYDELELDEFVMRAGNIDLGDYENGEIKLVLTEDIYADRPAIFGEAFATGWVPIENTMVPIPVDEDYIVEAPRAFVTRDLDTPPLLIDRIWAGARNQGDGAVQFEIRTRIGADPFEEAGTALAFFPIGELTTAIAAGTAETLGSIEISPFGDTQAEILAQLAKATAAEVGQGLANIFAVGTELLGFEDFSPSGGNITLSTVYRNLMDTMQKPHSIGDKVYLISLGGNITFGAYPAGSTVDVRLIPQSQTDELAESSAPNTAILMADRARRPYPPVALRINGSGPYPVATVDLATAFGGSLDDRGLSVLFRRRDFRTVNEVASVVSDTAGLNPGFPADDSTRYAIEIINDPSTVPFSLGLGAYNAGEDTILVSRTFILRQLLGVIPTELQTQVFTRHTYEGVDFDAFECLCWPFPVEDTQLAGEFNGGVVAQNVPTTAFVIPGTVPVNTKYDLEIGNALTTGDVDVRKNGAGVWSTVITTGNTTGQTSLSFDPGDTLEIRHTGTNDVAETLVLALPSAGSGGTYAVLTF